MVPTLNADYAQFSTCSSEQDHSIGNGLLLRSTSRIERSAQHGQMLRDVHRPPVIGERKSPQTRRPQQHDSRKGHDPVFSKQAEAVKMEGFNEKTSAIIEEVVVQVQSYVDSSDYKLLFYVEAEDSWVAPSLHAQKNDQITWIRTDHGLAELVVKLFYGAPDDRRWTAFSLVVEDDAFDVNFYFSDDLPPGDNLEERTQTILEAHFGDGPVTYPPFPASIGTTD